MSRAVEVNTIVHSDVLYCAHVARPDVSKNGRIKFRFVYLICEKPQERFHHAVEIAFTGVAGPWGRRPRP